MANDDQKREIEIAARWVVRLGMAPWTFRACATGVQARDVEHTTATYRGRHRRIVVRRAPSRTNSRRGSPPPDPSTVDPWATEPDALEARTRSSTTCSSCSGVGRRTCESCDGSGTTPCGTCAGKGSVTSDRTGTRSDCGACRASGKRSCSCVEGQRSCNTCAGSGAVEAWLAVVETTFERRVTGGDRDATAGAVALRWSGARADAPNEAKSWLDILSPEARDAERVDSVTIEVRRARVVDVAYRLAGAAGVVRVVGDGVTHAVRSPFGARTALALLGLAAAGTWASAMWIAYAGRHTWYAASEGSAALLGLGGALAVVGAALAAELCVPGRRLAWRGVLASGVAAVFLAQVGAAASSGAPSMDSAEAALAAGATDRAVTEATACADLGVEVDRAHDLLDRTRLLAIEAEPDLGQAAALSREGFHDMAAASRAREAVRSKVERRVTADQAAGTWDTTEPLVAFLPEPDRGTPVVLALLAAHALHRLDGCIEGLDPACASAALVDAAGRGASEVDVQARRKQAEAVATAKLTPAWTTIRSKAALPERQQACLDIRAPLDFAVVAGTGSFRPTPTDVDAACAKVVAAVDAERRRAEAAAAAKAKRESEALKREEARQAAAAARAAWANAPLLCADGSVSPSCTCGYPKSGCCSHHGGVAGCSR